MYIWTNWKQDPKVRIHCNIIHNNMKAEKPKRPSTDDSQKLVHNSAVKRKYYDICHNIDDLKNIMPREMRQTQKKTPCISTHLEYQVQANS